MQQKTILSKLFSGLSISPQISQIHPKFLIFVVALIGMLAPFTIDTYLPSFPAIEAELAASRAHLSQTLAVYLIGFAVATLVWGPLADKFGRRKIILLSLSSYVLASIYAALASSIEHLMLARFLQGSMVAGSLVASRAMLRDYFKGDEAQKAMALMMMLFAFAPAVAPIIGGWLEVTFGWRSVFLFLSAYGLLIFLLFFPKIGETQNPEHIQSLAPTYIGKSYLEASIHPMFMRLVLAQGFVIGGFFLYVAGSASIIFDHLYLGEQDFWQVFVPIVAGTLFGSIFVHRATSKISTTGMVSLALSVAAFGVVLNMVFDYFLPVTTWFVIIPLIIYAFGFAVSNPGLTLLALDCFPTKRGLASSVQSLFQMGMAGLVTAFVLPLVQHDLSLMVYAQAGLLSIAILFWLSVKNKAETL